MRLTACNAYPARNQCTACWDSARRRLTQSATPIAQTALDVGRYHHSDFTKRFVEHIGVTPSQYRERFGQGIPQFPDGTST